MWKNVYEHARVTLRVAEAVARNREEIREVRRELGEIAAALQALRTEVARVGGHAGGGDDARRAELGNPPAPRRVLTVAGGS